MTVAMIMLGSPSSSCGSERGRASTWPPRSSARFSRRGSASLRPPMPRRDGRSGAAGLVLGLPMRRWRTIAAPMAVASALLLRRSRPRSVQPPMRLHLLLLELRPNREHPRRIPSVVGGTAAGVIPEPFVVCPSEGRVPRSGTTTSRPRPPRLLLLPPPRPLLLWRPLLQVPRKIHPTEKPSWRWGWSRSCPPILPYRSVLPSARKAPRVSRLQLLPAVVGLPSRLLLDGRLNVLVQMAVRLLP
mmetsp:Transcript_19920/g.47122  ORF Transcript_19920/g.47122 Transcript_19920/m.47122 type:complete len:244 (+) Transcript_19920:769-1500(+)